ncbi:ABC transporter permease [Elizabethkingia anophelis]|uniref:ABC transporter permease n=1 Tax=Elizabethkingia anophelis TaxID=1117645 RepID=UPI000530F8F4|nr:ABC transporter permease [Elizabethkingia anophelis]KGT08881.1 ABC transporter permease [Elizabethkingia anophelis]MCT3646308.1 ABC transporter permease [Elizabethkingia anophelis]MCT3647394.1 ABC transporter permease [Elizabethkingia anophelis]MCT3693917.1 ABC transporter permease [Elizabethkingia anophelis]MCT3764196.1 ABC transporter permease [Elizabethkingia anophelis]
MDNLENNKENKWTEIIEPQSSLLSLNLKEVWRYRDLLLLLVKRDFVTYFKQTILGPIWFFVNPILTTLIYTLVFGNIAGISTNGTPKIAFYLSGVVMWNYFSTSLTQTSTVFTVNAPIFGKVYFPRLIMPLSIVVSNLMQFGIQFLLFLIIVVYYTFQGQLHPNIFVLLTPVLIILMAAFALGVGMIFSSMTTKYKDMAMLLTFGVQLFMYATPIVYPLSTINDKYKYLIELNPLTAIIENFRYAFLGSGSLNIEALGYSCIMIGILLAIGTIIFNRIQKGFMDTI